jgi:hypothetical protein
MFGCFVAALLAPVDISALGVLVLGPLHIAFELRCVVSVAPHLRSRNWGIPTVGIALFCALVRAFTLSSRYEVALVGLLAVGAALATSKNFGLLRALIIASVVGCLVGVGIWVPVWWLMIVAHLHNILPLLVSLRRMGKWFALRAASLYVLACALFLSGAVDSLLRGASSSPLTVAGRHLKIERVAAAITPPSLAGVWSLRWLALFSFGQLMHYAFWCGILRPDRATMNDQPLRRWATRAGFGAATVVTALLLFVGARMSAADARAFYGTYAIVHIVFEVPALFALLGAMPKRRLASRYLSEGVQ